MIIKKISINSILRENIMFNEWRNFKIGKWNDGIDVSDFIRDNYTQYEGNESFLSNPTDSTNKLWSKLQDLQREERNKGGAEGTG